MQAVDEFGIVTRARLRAALFSQRHPQLERKIMGRRPVYLNAKETHITVDIPSGVRVVNSPIDLEAMQREVDKRAAELLKAEIERLAIKRAAEQVALLEASAPISRVGMTSIRDIFTAVSFVTNFSIDELLGPRRSKKVVAARHIAYWLLRELRPDLSYPAIGRAVGQRDHTTILSGIRRFQVVRDTAPTNMWLEHPAISALVGKMGTVAIA